MLEQTIRAASIALMLLSNIIASYFDIVSREIPDKTWIPGVAASALALYYVLAHGDAVLRALYLVDVMLGLVIFTLIFLLKLAGGADAKSILLISLSVLPHREEASTLLSILNLPVVSVIVNSLIGVLMYVIYICVKNRKSFRVCEQLYELRGFEKILLRISCLCLPVREILRGKHKLYPLINKREFKPTLSVEDRVSVLMELVDAGILRESDLILAIYYMPYIVCITLGLVLHVALNGSLISLIAKYF